MSLRGQKTTTTSLDWDVFKSLINNLENDKNYRYCLLISVGVFTGLRISDLLPLRFSQFEENEYLTISEYKTGKILKIKINPDLRDIIDRVKIKMGVTDNNHYLFVNRYGTKPIDRSWINVNLKRIFKQYGVNYRGNISTHLFRKTLGDRVLKLNNFSDESFRMVMKLFGHYDISFTKKYLGIHECETKSVYDSLRL